MPTDDLRDLSDAELFVQIGGDWGVGDCLTELARRLADLRAELNRLREAMKEIVSTAGHPEAAEGCRLIIGVARSALKEEK